MVKTVPNPVSMMRSSSSAVPRRLRGLLSLDDFEGRARRHLPLSIFGYVSGGVEDDVTLSENRLAFRRIGLRPRVLRDVSGRDLTTRLFGQDYALPFGIAHHRGHGRLFRGGRFCIAR